MTDDRATEGYRIIYRPDVDGLRAIAILLVIGFHAFPSIFRGGFVGVDIFFVISGFLISTIILGDLEQDNFSYRRFYFRRIKRIFPALILVIVANALIGWFVLLPDEFKQLGKHIAGGNGFVSNLVLWGEAGYFDNSSETKPLLHLWSLGIEEQFYIVWPIILVLIWKLRASFLVVLLLITVTSFSTNLFTLHHYSTTSAFYLPMNRFWELLIGGALAYIAMYRANWQSKRDYFVILQSILGVVLIVIALVGLEKGMAFPGWYALLPSIGAFLIIANATSPVSRFVLGNRALVYIGLISYPLYLWHWSLLAYANILGMTSWEARAVAVVLSLALSVLTYEFVENWVKKNTSPGLVYGLVGVSFFLLCGGLVTFAGFLSPRNGSPEVHIISEAVRDWEYPKGLESIEINGVRAFIKKGTEEIVLFFGDSHIEQYAPRIEKLIENDPLNTKSAVFATRGGCLPIPNCYRDRHPSCSAKFREAIVGYALSAEVDSVVIGASWGNLIRSQQPMPGADRYYYLLDGQKRYFDEDGIDYALVALEDLIASITIRKKVFLVVDNPTGEEFDPRARASGSRILGTVGKGKKVYFQEYGHEQAKLRSMMIMMAKRTDAIVIDPIKHFCEENQCRIAMDDGTPIYKDGGHIRASYVKEFVKYLDVTVKK